MDYFRLNRLSEADFDGIVRRSGGDRTVPDDSRETHSNADYALDDAVLELKLFEEEGLAKKTRREKVAAIFRGHQPDRPVIVIDPDCLDEDAQRHYYHAMEGPIQTHVRKAAQQVHASQGTLGGNRVSVLVAINNGYTALDHDEFSRIVVKRATNDTSKIHYVVTGGVYYYSDGFDNYFIAPFELFAIRDAAPFASFENLREHYRAEIERQTTALIDGPTTAAAKLPVIDLFYDLDGIRYVKPAPPMGVPSTFYTNGRPRRNSTGITRCPPIATVFPRCTLREWEGFRAGLRDFDRLCATYAEWQAWSDAEGEAKHQTLKPFVPVDVTWKAFDRWCVEESRERTFADLCEFATATFEVRIQEIIGSARAASDARIARVRYIALFIEEIGQDEANDLATLRFVSEVPGCEREVTLFKHQRIFRAYAIAVAAAYALRENVDAVFYTCDKTYSWS